jgi:cytochrome P450
MTTPRYLTRDVDVGGRTLRAGETVALVWASGNRDAAHFTTPDECRVDRTDNDHLVFGRGIHKCLGIFIALSEIRIAVEELLLATENFQLDGEPTRTNWERFGVSRLPMLLTPADARGRV